MSKKQQTIDTYNTTAGLMAEKFTGIGARVNDILQAFSYIKKSSQKVVEIGCGNGRDAREILKYTSDYIGMDVSSEMIRLAQEYFPEATSKFVVADVEDFDFPKWIDVIFSFASLLHTPKEKLQEVLWKMLLTLNPGWIVFLSLKRSDSYEEITKTDEFWTRTYYYYSPQDILDIGGKEYLWNKIEYQDLRGQKWFTIILWK